MSVAIQFDSNQLFQSEAVDSVLNLFVGSTNEEGADSSVLPEVLPDVLFEEKLFQNHLSITHEVLKSNIRKVQNLERVNVNGISEPIVPLELQKPFVINEVPADFAIEMETGTGKTYVYLKTAIELYLKYGLSKFVIVVPSVAIREGVLSTLRLTKEHFREIYSGIQFDSFVYDSRNVNKLRQFATSAHLQILVMNISAFNRDENIIRKEVDSLNGYAPIDFIKSVHPVVIMDEPQKLSSILATKAIEDLSPIFRLRYSATHKEVHHLVYRLTPIDAYNMRLVKRIDVLSIDKDQDGNTPYVEVLKVSNTTSSVTAKILVIKRGKSTQVVIRRNTDLEVETNNPTYQGWVVEDIHAATENLSARVEFGNGKVLQQGANTEVHADTWQRAQIRATIEDHFDTELRLQQYASIGIIFPTKPLTLFFIDRVANYAPEAAKFRVWFEEDYVTVAALSKYRNLVMPPASKSHNGYFAITKQGAKDTKEGKGNKEDEEAFDLIMKDKERLISLEEPVRFIFSHSALAEGWDNPNVFTICNLQETRSEGRRRQQIGRGLRLPVMSNGERCRIEEINHLTVIATESFEKFAAGLQVELKDETGLEFSELVKNKRDRVTLVPKQGYEGMPGFRELWNEIAQRTKYQLDFSSEDLVKEAVKRLGHFEKITDLKMRISKQNVSEINIEKGIVGGTVQTKAAKAMTLKIKFPDILKDLSNDVPVSRATIYRVIMESGRLQEAAKNPAEFVSQVRSALFGALAATLKDHDGIKYSKRERGPDSSWRMEFFNTHFAESYEDNLIKVTKSIYDRIPVDSIIERKFAEGLEAREDVDLFLKLPSWFKIDTPVGGYNPDWAIVRRDANNQPKLYLVRETKGTTNLDELFRESEVWKVVFGGKHFDAIGVDYKMVRDSNDLDKDEIPKIEPSVWEEALNQPE
jgi:type III restriction enzyme